MTSNADIARALQELVDLLVLAEGSKQAFRVRAYEKAVAAVQSLPREAAELSAAELERVPGIGKSTAAKIREYVDKGSIARVTELRKRFPAEMMELMRIPGLGPKTVVMLRDRLGVTSVEQLKQAIADDALQGLPGLGTKSQQKIAIAIERLGLHGKDRRNPIAEAMGIASLVVDALAALDSVTRVQYCGSLRRFRETIADIDIVVASNSPQDVMESFISMSLVAEVIGHGDTKTSVLTATGLQIDVRVVKPSQFGAAILYFTGSKQHNIELRQRSIDQGLLLNEYGLEETDGGKVVASRTEASIYKALDLDYIPPEMREGIGEIEAAAERQLPNLIDVGDLRGDLHVHSTWSGDGRSSLDDMVAAAAGRGLEYIAITEHGEDLAINGLSRDQIAAERRELERLRLDYPDLTILSGSELNIDRHGNVDYDPDFLETFDWCVASIHTHFDLSEAEQTDRLLTAMENPAVSAIGHLTGRRIGHRPGIELNARAVFEAAAATGTALEINGHLHRLDVPSDLLLQARGIEGLKFVISTDSHHTSEFANLEWGVHNARRGWVERSSVINTLPFDEFLEFVNRKRN
ncbi:MAG: DNA polymerase/3'-5' exonuclease PolX [Acidimicrobiia bacterium]|nr:DNA polymerase/3'-5' exonuclease PolX [Acidimicrobiia bacterium]